MNLDDPIALALLAAERLTAGAVPHALYGGLALAAYGRPRETKDADVAVLDADGHVARAALDGAPVMATVPFERVRFGGLSITRVTVLGDGGGHGLNTVDLVQPLSARFAADVMERAIVAPLRSQPIRVVAPEDFVLLKLLSTRDTDLDDARSVLTRSGAALDRSALEREVATLAKELIDHDVIDRWSRLQR